MSEGVVIDSRFRGPPNSANGGYACGVVAAAVDAPIVEATLRVPPPIDREMERRPTDGGAELYDGETLVAEAKAVAELDLDPPEPVGLEAAETARRGSPLHAHHPFPMCFVCGPDRGPGDGLCVICGPVEGREAVAAPWEIHPETPLDDDGNVAPEIVWSVLDCPSGLAGLLVPEMGTCVLGRLTGEIVSPIDPSRPHVAVGWPVDYVGRKFRGGTAIFTAEGELVAQAAAVWIELKG